MRDLSIAMGNIGATPEQFIELRRWLGTRSFQVGVTVHYTAEFAGGAGDPGAPARLSHFNDMAFRHGVSDDTTP